MVACLSLATLQSLGACFWNVEALMNVIRRRILKIPNLPFVLQIKGVKVVFVRDAAVDHPLRPLPEAVKLARRWESRVVSTYEFGASTATGYLASAPAHCLGDPKPIQGSKARPRQPEGGVRVFEGISPDHLVSSGLAAQASRGSTQPILDRADSIRKCAVPLWTVRVSSMCAIGMRGNARRAYPLMEPSVMPFTKRRIEKMKRTMTGMLAIA